jgi:hypothetical protein
MEKPQPNPLDRYSSLITSRAELGVLSFFAPTEAERDAAKRLLKVVPEEREPEHILTALNRILPEGSEAERLSRPTPMGKLVEQICAEQPLENQLEDFVAEFSQDFEEALAAKPQLPPAAPAPATELEDLAQRTSLANTIKQRNEGPVIEKPKVILPPDDWGFGQGTLL